MKNFDWLTAQLLDLQQSPTSDCREWPFGNVRGYGYVKRDGIDYAVHRLAYRLASGSEIPNGLCVCHKCDNPKCFNPLHLWLGTRKENNADRDAKGRTRFAPVCGVAVSTAIVDESRVLEIRRLAASGIRQNKIAKAFGLYTSHISNIVTRKTWKHI